MQFPEIVSPTIKEMFIEKISGMIISGKLSPGDKLPPESELASQMHISKSIVHLGLMDLERLGFVNVVPRQGTFVANYAEKGSLETLYRIQKYNGGKLDKRTTESLIEFRFVVEGLVLKKFAESHTDEDIQILHNKIDSVRKCMQNENSDLSDMARCIFDFHYYLFLKSGNTIFPLIMNAFFDVSLSIWENMIKIFGKEESISYHEKYIDFMEAGDGEGAVNYLNEGVKFFLERLEY